MITKEQIAGLVLAGGQGRRMSVDGAGLDKGLQLLQGRPLALHVAIRLQEQVGMLWINANQHTEQYEAFGFPVFRDAQSNSLEAFAGPLAGLYTGLSLCAAMGDLEYLATAPCDSPFFPADMVGKLARKMEMAGAVLAVVKTGQFAQPVFCLMRLDVKESLREFLHAGGRKIDLWYGQLAHVEVEFDDIAAFENINTPADLQQAALRIAS
jgi:molybdenum cofactor guanylyltransferase